jgi:hypothetical protein
MSARFLQLSDGAPSRPNDCGTETSRPPADDTKPGEAEEHHRPGRRLWHRSRIGRAGQHAKGEIGGEGMSGGGRMLLVPEQILVRIRADGPGGLEVPGNARARHVGKAETGGVTHDRLKRAEDRHIEDGKPRERLDFSENVVVGTAWRVRRRAGRRFRKPGRPKDREPRSRVGCARHRRRERQSPRPCSQPLA